MTSRGVSNRKISRWRQHQRVLTERQKLHQRKYSPLLATKTSQYENKIRQARHLNGHDYGEPSYKLHYDTRTHRGYLNYVQITNNQINQQYAVDNLCSQFGKYRAYTIPWLHHTTHTHLILLAWFSWLIPGVGSPLGPLSSLLGFGFVFLGSSHLGLTPGVLEHPSGCKDTT